MGRKEGEEEGREEERNHLSTTIISHPTASRVHSNDRTPLIRCWVESLSRAQLCRVVTPAHGIYHPVEHGGTFIQRIEEIILNIQYVDGKSGAKLFRLSPRCFLLVPMGATGVHRLALGS